jgi:putative DNA primase/helicase
VTAAGLFKLGRSIIPCGPDKRPAIPSWKPYQDRLPTAQEVADWQKQAPSAWAMITGKVSGVITLDFDGEPGRRTLESLRLKPHRRTPSGGFHVDFEYPGWHVPTWNCKAKVELGKRYPGLDVRADGGYACFTGGCNGGRYTWLRDPEPDSLDILPADLREFLGLAHAPAPVNGKGHGHAAAEDAEVGSEGPAASGWVGGPHTSVAERLLDKALGRAARDGRNVMGHWLACQLRDARLTKSEAMAFVLGNYVPRVSGVNMKGQPEPYTKEEAHASVEQAYSRPAREGPRVVVMPESKVDLLTQLRNDFGNSQRLIALHGSNLRYCPPLKKWVVFDGRRWEVDEAERARSRAQDTMRKFLVQAAEASHEDCAKFAAGCLNSARVTNCLREAQPSLVIMPYEMDQDPDVLNFLNGVVDLRTGEIREHRREDYITKLVHFDYQPDAACPNFLSFLKRAMANHPRLMATGYLQKAAGYSLTGRTSEKVVFFVYGPTNTGKTTLLNLLRSTYGADYAVVIQIDSIMARQRELSTNAQADLADLRGARFAMTSETEQGQRLSVGQIKRITQGMGTIKSVRKYENPITFPESHKLWADANYLPAVGDTDDSIWGRLHAIPFDVTIPKAEQDRDLPAKLAAEAPGILAWAVAGAVRWYTEGLGLPEDVKQAAGKWRAKSDQIGRFIEERCIAGAEVDGIALKVMARTLYTAYRAWADGAGEHPIAEAAFADKIAEMKKFLKKKVGSGYEYRGIALRGGNPDPDEIKERLNKKYPGGS